MTARTYAEKLRDPRWQRRRLEVMGNADFACEACGAIHLTLNVHHTLYRKGADPWEYSDEELRCLCEGCHGIEHEIRDVISLNMSFMSLDQLQRLRGYSAGILVASGSFAVDDDQLRACEPETRRGFNDCCGS